MRINPFDWNLHVVAPIPVVRGILLRDWLKPIIVHANSTHTIGVRVAKGHFPKGNLVLSSTKGRTDRCCTVQ